MSTEIQENISPDKTNEITETDSTNNKIKDPRKVAEGKKLAEKNKIVREEEYNYLYSSLTTILYLFEIGLTTAVYLDFKNFINFLRYANKKI